jgi:gluconate 2-dehydrogenase gamma chain
VIKLGAIAAASALAGLNAKAAAQTAGGASQTKAPLFFTPEEFALVDELTELISPADDHSPGARAAQVAAYLDFRFSESFEEEPKRIWRDGLKLVEQLSQEMHGKTFLQSSPEQRIALLTRISQNEKKPEKPEEVFFKELKLRTARAYYSSKIGIHTEMEYKGNTYLKEFAGYDAT